MEVDLLVDGARRRGSRTVFNKAVLNARRRTKKHRAILETAANSHASLAWAFSALDDRVERRSCHIAVTDRAVRPARHGPCGLFSKPSCSIKLNA